MTMRVQRVKEIMVAAMAWRKSSKGVRLFIKKSLELNTGTSFAPENLYRAQGTRSLLLLSRESIEKRYQFVKSPKNPKVYRVRRSALKEIFINEKGCMGGLATVDVAQTPFLRRQFVASSGIVKPLLSYSNCGVMLSSLRVAWVLHQSGSSHFPGLRTSY